MWVLTVAQRLRQRRLHEQFLRHLGGVLRFFRAEGLHQVLGNGAIIIGRTRVHLGGQRAPQVERCVAFGFDLLGHRRVIGRIRNHRYALVILRCTAQHRRTANVDILNRILQRDIRLSDRFLEWI